MPLRVFWQILLFLLFKLSDLLVRLRLFAIFPLCCSCAYSRLSRQRRRWWTRHLRQTLRFWHWRLALLSLRCFRRRRLVGMHASAGRFLSTLCVLGAYGVSLRALCAVDRACGRWFYGCCAAAVFDVGAALTIDEDSAPFDGGVVWDLSVFIAGAIAVYDIACRIPPICLDVAACFSCNMRNRICLQSLLGYMLSNAIAITFFTYVTLKSHIHISSVLHVRSIWLW